MVAGLAIVGLTPKAPKLLVRLQLRVNIHQKGHYQETNTGMRFLILKLKDDLIPSWEPNKGEEDHIGKPENGIMMNLGNLCQSEILILLTMDDPRIILIHINMTGFLTKREVH